MHELLPQYIDRISREVRKHNIVYSYLADELIDHICCDVEDEMENGLTFNEAFTRVKQKFSRRRLKEIQEETLYAIDTKYKIMKNLMKISAVIGTIVFGLSALFKIQHWSGAGIMITLGAVTLAFVFLPSALVVLWKETNSKKRLFLFISSFFALMFFIMGILFKVQHWPGGSMLLALSGFTAILFVIPLHLSAKMKDPGILQPRTLYIAGYAGLALYIAGFLFKIMHWPGAAISLISGLGLLFIIVFPWYTFNSWKDTRFVKAEFIFIVAGSLAIIMPSTLLNLKLQRSFDLGFYQTFRQQQNLNAFLQKSNFAIVKQYKDSLQGNIMEQVHSRTVFLLDLTDKIGNELSDNQGTDLIKQQDFLTADDGNALKNELNQSFLENALARSTSDKSLFPGNELRIKLDNAIDNYEEFISTTVSDGVSDKINNILQSSLLLPSSAAENESSILISGLHSLLVLKNNILAAESMMLKDLTASH